jgi:CheY-like chemotaxis protein
VVADQAGLKFSVIDTGPGIPADQQERLFQKFVQVDASYTREAGGTGLGLAISKRLVELMRGQVGFTSREGLGSTFWFTLPLSFHATSRPPFGLPAPVQTAEMPPPRQRSDLRVLVVDDNPINVQLAVAFLDKLGCLATVATDGVSAVSRVKAEKFDLVLMDCQMPGMDGFQTTQTIRAWEADQGAAGRLPIIAITANALEARARCFESGMNAFISKPFKLADLVAAIDTVFAGRSPLPAPDLVPGSTAETAPAVLSGSAMDPAQALQLADNNPGLLRMLARAFLSQQESVLLEIRRAIARRDSPALRDQAHKLKGSVALFAAEGVWAAALALENHVAPPDWPALEHMGGRLEAEMKRLLPEISALELVPADESA